MTEAEIQETPPEKTEAEKTIEQAEQSTEFTETESSKDDVNLIQNQAARFAYIEQLERKINTDAFSENGEFLDIMQCKSQILVELVGVADYLDKMPADSPHRQAADILLKHLYKCYDKTESMYEKIASDRSKKRTERQMTDTIFSNAYRDEQIRRQMALLDDGDIFPTDRLINLSGIGLSAGSLGMVTQLIDSPTESIKAQLPDLIEEYTSKLTGTDLSGIHKKIGTIVEGLSALKNPQSMVNALENPNLISNVMSMMSGNSL